MLLSLTLLVIAEFVALVFLLWRLFEINAQLKKMRVRYHRASSVAQSKPCDEVESDNQKLLEQQKELNQQRRQLAAVNLELSTLHKEVKLEKERSDRLLLNILPERVAEELKNTGKSKPESFDDVTVFFSDIVSFTRKSSMMSTEVVIEELNMIFTNFDKIFKKHHCQRIKTSGDCYIAASGMPESDPRHAYNVLNAAIEAMAFVRTIEESEYHWQMRMGIHSGPVVGGIVGSDKYLYDVFGDTMNVAARMERYSEPMRINVSEDTYALAGDEFSFIARGQIETKGKGLISMYFLEETD